MATRVRLPGANPTSKTTVPAIQGPSPSLTAGGLLLSPSTSFTDEYNHVIDYLINGGEEGGADRVAFHYYRRIPELHYLVSLVGAALSQVTLKVQELTPGEDPKDVGPRHPANDLLKQLAGGFQGQADMMQRLGIHLTVAGDSVVILPGPQAANLSYPYDAARVFAATEVSSRSGKIYLKMPNMRDEQIPPESYAVRIWKEAPESMWASDSPVKSAFTVLREIDLLDQHVHASAISRLKSAGILVIPEEMTLPGDEVETEGLETDPFVRVLVEVMELAIKNRDSAAALVPIIMRGPYEFLDKIRLIDFQTPFDAEVKELRDNALRRLALGMDAPPEVLLGSSASAGWSMWQVSESQLRLHLKPLAHLIARSLTTGWLQPALRSLPLADQTREGIDRIAIVPVFDQLTIRPDVGQDAAALYAEGGIGLDTYRHIVGLSDNDAPTPKELEFEIYWTTLKTNPAMAAWAVKGLKDHFQIDLIDSEGAQAVGGAGDSEADQRKAEAEAVKAEAEAKAAAVGTPPAQVKPGSAPVIPGDRSKAKQTAAPKAPPADGDGNNNTPTGRK